MINNISNAMIQIYILGALLAIAFVLLAIFSKQKK